MSDRYSVLNHGGVVGGFFTPGIESEAEDVAGALQVVEDVGWVLDRMEAVYVTTKQRSNLVTDSANVTGNITGIYVFRRPASSTTTPPPPPPA